MTMIIRPLGSDVDTPTTSSTVSGSKYVRCVNKTSSPGELTNRLVDVTRIFVIDGENFIYRAAAIGDHSIFPADGSGDFSSVKENDIIIVILGGIQYSTTVGSVNNVSGLSLASIDIPVDDYTITEFTATGLRTIDTTYTIAGNEVLVIAKSTDEEMSTSASTIELTPVSVTR